MNILYFTWNENSASDCIACMKDLGHSITVYDTPPKSYTADDSFEEAFSKVLLTGFDCVFTFNYFPVISRVCNSLQTPYISWVYDSPHLTLESHTISNPCNHIYIFDRDLALSYRQQGFNTISYMPLGYYGKRIHDITKGMPSPSHDLTFIGNLYNDQYNFLDQIESMPAYLKGYIDAIIEANLDICGTDMIESLFKDDKCKELSQYANIALGPDYRDCTNEMFRNMIRKKCTVVERKRLLKMLSGELNVDLYSGSKPDSDINVNFCGYAENRLQMPVIFATSKINLNITLRTIKSGIPLRIIDILGAGGFCLTDYRKELSEYLIEGEDIVSYISPEDLYDKACYYLDLSHESERIRIAENGHKKAAELFTYEHLLPQILKL